MKTRIASLSGQDVRIVDVFPRQWLSVSFPGGWIPLLKKLERAVAAGRVPESPPSLTLVGHSLGGVLGYLYLIAPPLRGYQLRGHKYIQHLVTLGSPHRNQRRWLYGGLVAREVERWAAKNAPPENVMITCIAGKSVLGQPKGSPAQRKAFSIYKKLGGEGEVWGDGIIPVSSALLPQAKPVVLEGVGHFPLSRNLWYGSPGVVDQWWPKIRGGDPLS
jgi:hypothetical protein